MLPRRGTFTLLFFSRSYIRFLSVLPFAIGDHPLFLLAAQRVLFFYDEKRSRLALLRRKISSCCGCDASGGVLTSLASWAERRRAAAYLSNAARQRAPASVSLPPASNCPQRLQNRRRHCVAFHKFSMASLKPEIYFGVGEGCFLILSLPFHLFPFLSFPFLLNLFSSLFAPLRGSSNSSPDGFSGVNSLSGIKQHLQPSDTFLGSKYTILRLWLSPGCKRILV